MRPDSLLLNMAPLRFFGSAKMRYVLAECCAWVFFLAPTSYRDRLVEDRQSSQNPLPNDRLTTFSLLASDISRQGVFSLYCAISFSCLFLQDLFVCRFPRSCAKSGSEIIRLCYDFCCGVSFFGFLSLWAGWEKRCAFGTV